MPPKRWDNGFCGIILDEPSGFYKMYDGKRMMKSYCAHDKALPKCRSEYCMYVARTKLGLKAGGAVCKHDKLRSKCRVAECGGGGEYCEHGKQRSRCRVEECGGGGEYCEHGTRRSQCRVAECGGGSAYCEHGTRRSLCRVAECGGGSAYCEHDKLRSRCRVAECGGGSAYCEHLTRHGTPKQRHRCDVCSPEGYIVHLRRHRRYNAFKSAGADKSTRALDDLGMALKDWRAWLAESFRRRYGRDPNPDEEVHIDEIIPCSAWTFPDDNKYCWHYMNSQLLTEGDNQAKNATYSEEDKKAMISRIDGA